MQIPDIDFREHWRIIVIAVAGAALLAIIISIIAALASREKPEEAPAPELSILEMMPQLSSDLQLYPEKFRIPDAIDDFWFGRYTPLDAPKRAWSMEEFQRYWYDPAAIGAESLRAVNEDIIEEILNSSR